MPAARAGHAVRPRAAYGPPPTVVAYAPVLPALATVLLLCVPTAGPDPGAAATSRITPADAASAVLVLCCAVTVLRGGRRVLSPAAAVVLAAPAVAFGLAAAVAADPYAGLTGFCRYAQVFVLLPASLVLLLRSRRDFRLVAGAMVVLALVQGAIGVHQYATGTGASYAGRPVRAVGTFGALDVMGMSTVVAYGTVVALAFALAPPAGAPRWFRGAALGCAAALAVPLAVSFSRGAWIATGLAALVMLLLTGVRRALRVLAVVLAAAVVLVGGAGVGTELIGERLSSITRVTAAPDRSVTDRYAMWDAAVSMWRDAPVAGVGLKGFPEHRDGHASLGLSSGSDTAGAGQDFQREPLLSPHNMYLLLLSEQGLAGLTLVAGSWAALLAAGARRLLRTRHATRGHGGEDGDGGVPGGRGCGLAAVGLLVWQGVDFLYADIGGPSTVLTGVLLGLAAWWAFAPAAVAPRGAGPGGYGPLPKGAP
ncbi:O-antigen ligase domain-containing protein [Streptomyces sp. Z26]|nr:O-antigen ligase domain-containing protein [Streptomyces sp. Z26]